MIQLSSFFSVFIVLAAFHSTCVAHPTHGADPTSTGWSLSLSRRSSLPRNTSETINWARERKAALESKYGLNVDQSLRDRSSGLNLVSNQNADSSYFGSIAVGTPPISYDVILDTGSADLWLVSDAARGDIPEGTATYDPTQSSTYKAQNVSFAIRYGSGSAQGVLGRDVVQFAGFEVRDQAFGVVSSVTDTLLDAPVSGLLGLAFQGIAASGAPPLWAALAAAPGTLDAPLMAVHLTRFVNASGARAVEPGGTFTLGGVNASLYAGAIDYQPVAGGAGYWTLPMAEVVVQGKSLDLSADGAALAAIDTGTTLVGGPPDVIEQLYASIPGSVPASGEYAGSGYYTFPCATDVNIALRFGSSNISWPIAPADFRLVALDDDSCLGAFFALSSANSIHSAGAPSWIIGDTFLKNVYSVFRAEPPSVGFAQLSSVALAMNGVERPVPVPTIGSPTATVTGQASGTRGLTVPSLLWLLCLALGMFTGYA